MLTMAEITKSRSWNFSYYGFLPVNEDGKTDMEVEMEKKEEDSDEEQKHHFTYKFHPYYGKFPIK